MSSDEPVAHGSGEGPGSGPGVIARFITAEQASEGPSLKTGGIAGSVASGKGIKRKLDSKSYETKYDAVMAVEKGGKSKTKTNCFRFWHSKFNSFNMDKK